MNKYRNQKYEIEKSHPKEWTLPCTFMHLQNWVRQTYEKIVEWNPEQYVQAITTPLVLNV